MAQSQIHNISRRKAIKEGLINAFALALGISHSPLNANSYVGSRTDNDMDLANLINTLRAIDKAVCDTAAEVIEKALDTGSSLYLHLRNAELNPSDVLNLGEALRALSNNDTKPLLSFSVSYNSTLGDTGAIVLAQSLPHSLQEVGFVNCNIHDAGGVALLHWAKQNRNLKMICIEGNSFTTETQSLFRLFSQDNPELTVIF